MWSASSSAFYTAYNKRDSCFLPIDSWACTNMQMSTMLIAFKRTLWKELSEYVH